jgi:hypothetical protein
MLALKRFSLWVIGVVCLAVNSQVSAIPIDLNTFAANDYNSVAISADGSSASFKEDFFNSPIALENSGYLMPDQAAELSFDYELVVAANNTDYFDFYLGDLSAPLFSVGGQATDSPLVFSDTLTIDISGYSNSLVPMVFDLAYGWSDRGLESTLLISNVNASIPEPATLFLVAFGLLGMTVFSFRSRGVFCRNR